MILSGKEIERRLQSGAIRHAPLCTRAVESQQL